MVISLVEPPTPTAILNILKESNIDLKIKKVALFGYGRLVGRFLVPMLIKDGAVISVIEKTHPKDMAKQISTSSDIIISAVGEGKFIKEDMVKRGFGGYRCWFSILYPSDGGVDGKIVGDVDLDSVKDKIFIITSVPVALVQ